MMIQLPLRSSKVVWRHKSPNITVLLTNSIIPKERSYTSSHLCYNVYSSRIIDDEIESCVRSCIGVDIGIIGPILIQRYDVCENGIEVLKLEKLPGDIDYCFKRILLIPNIVENSIKDIKLHTSHDFHFSEDNGIYIYVRSINELSILRLYKLENESVLSVNYEIILSTKLKDILNLSKDNGKFKIDENTTIYSMVSSCYDYMELSLLLSNRIILKINFHKKNNYKFKLILNLNDICNFEHEVIQCLVYGDNPDTFILGGKSVYLLKYDLFLSKYIIKKIYPCKDDFINNQTIEIQNNNEYEHIFDDFNTLKSVVSYTDRLVKLQKLRKKNISLSNITGISVHPIYSNIIALIDSKTSKVIIIDIYQNSRVPLNEFSIPFTESIPNGTTRFRYIEWIFPKLINKNEQENECRCGIVLYCSNYPNVIYSLLNISYDRKNIDDFYKVQVIFVKELNMSKWDIEQDRKFYSPKKTQLLESSIDLLDNILNNYSIDDNFLAQYFHGFSGVTVFAHKNQVNKNNIKYYYSGIDSDLEYYKSEDYLQKQIQNPDRMVLIPQSTSKHYIFEYCNYLDNKIDDCFIFLALNTCGRLTTTSIYIINDENISFYNNNNNNNNNNNQNLNHDIQYYGLNNVYTCKYMKESLMELYSCFEQNNKENKNIIKNRSKIVPPNNINESLNYRNDHFNQDNYLNLELEVPNQQLTKRKYYNSKVYNAFDLLNLLLKDDDNHDHNKDNLQTTCIKLPLPISNGFDYIREFKNIPGILWSDESTIIDPNECVHIPSLIAQPFPLCSCRYFEINHSEDTQDIQMTNDYLQKKNPLFDIVGVRDYQYNYTLEEYLSFIPENNQDSNISNLKVNVPKDTLKSLSDHIFCLPLTPVSSKMSENYLKYHQYIGGKLSDSFIKKWKISQSCSRLNQPGCLLKYIIENEKQIEKILVEENKIINLLENNEEKEIRDKLSQEDNEFELYIESNLQHKDVDYNLDEMDIEHILNNDDQQISDFNTSHDDDENIQKETLPKRGICINKKLIDILEEFWDQSCEFYGLNSEEYNRNDTIDLLKDDLSQWYNYPFVSFETVDTNIHDKEQLKLSLMSYVDTQLSNI